MASANRAGGRHFRQCGSWRRGTRLGVFRKRPHTASDAFWGIARRVAGISEMCVSYVRPSRRSFFVSALFFFVRALPFFLIILYFVRVEQKTTSMNIRTFFFWCMVAASATVIRAQCYYFHLPCWLYHGIFQFFQNANWIGNDSDACLAINQAVDRSTGGDVFDCTCGTIVPVTSFWFVLTSVTIYTSCNVLEEKKALLGALPGTDTS